MDIDLYHDLVCPWCRIGKRHLDLARATWDGATPRVTYRPFFLDPTVPLNDPPPFREYLARRLGTANLDAAWARVAAAGAAVGLRFRFDRIARATNTARAHALLAMAPPASQNALIDVMHVAYFEEGADLADIATLANLAASVGMDASAVTAALTDGTSVEAITVAAQEAGQAGISGVPFFVFAQAVAVSGAQPANVLLAAMRQAMTGSPGA